MTLRTTGDLAPSKRSAKVGERVEFGAKVENGGAAPESVMLAVEDLQQQGFAFSFDPPATQVPAKGRARVAFAWTAALPEGVDAVTYRGKLVLRAMDGRLVGSGPLDLYVSRA